ncbi:MAG: hypothetical protein MUC49_03845 [Raineya sp.]|jgi:hypothetical protein|nr:hypothetical protein [Raineya sp.]
MKIFILILSLFCGLNQNLFGQILAEGMFHAGSVKDKEGNTWGGQIKYDTKQQTVLVDNGGTIKTFNARNVEGFSFFDTKVKANRRFVTLLYAKNINTNYETAAFFEVLTEGNRVTLLGTEYLETRMNPQAGWGWYGTGGRTFSYRIVTEFYIMNKNGKIVKLKTTSKKQFLSQMKENASQLEVFMKKNKLGVQQRLDMIKIFDYYNTL